MTTRLLLLIQACALWNSGDRVDLSLTEPWYESRDFLNKPYGLWVRFENQPVSYVGLVYKNDDGSLVPCEIQEGVLHPDSVYLSA